MAINYAKKYSETVDERFKLGALTEVAVNQDYEFIGVETVIVSSIPTVAMNDYTTSGTNRYGNPTELENTLQELTLTQDRSFTFTIDRKSRDDTQMTIEAGKALARQIDEVVIPEIDMYRLSKMVAGAGNVATGIVTKANAYEEFLKVQEMLDDDKVPVGGRMVYAKPSFTTAIKLDESFTKKGDMAQQMAIKNLFGEIDEVPVIKVPSAYLPTGVDFVITNRIVTTAPNKLTEYIIHDNPPGISGWLVEGRVRYDAFVLNQKKNAIGVHRSTD